MGDHHTVGAQYNLMVEGPDGRWEQEIRLTRPEYLSLKASLAGQRGIVTTFPPLAEEAEPGDSAEQGQADERAAAAPAADATSGDSEWRVDKDEEWSIVHWERGSGEDEAFLTKSEFMELKAHLVGLREAVAKAAPVAASGTDGNRAVEITVRVLGCQVDYLRTLETILKANRGCASPIEEFITSLLHRYRHSNGALTPDDVKRQLEEFEENFELALGDARMMNARYADLLGHTWVN